MSHFGAPVTSARKKSFLLLIMVGFLQASLAADKKKKGLEEAKDAEKSMKLARGWMGKLKGVLKIDETYEVVDSKDKIPALKDAEYSEEEMEDCKIKEGENIVVYINRIRSKVKQLIDQWIAGTQGLSHHYCQLVIDNLEECSMWLGFVLGEIREEPKKEEPKEEAK